MPIDLKHIQESIQMTATDNAQTRSASTQPRKHTLLWVIIMITLAFGVFGFSTYKGTYTKLQPLWVEVDAKTADLASALQRRFDLINQTVSTVEGEANFEKSTLLEVTNARAARLRASLMASSRGRSP